MLYNKLHPSSGGYKISKTLKTKLDKVLESIDPSLTLDEVSSRVDEAVNSFPTQKSLIKERDEFKKALTRFYCHVENSILQINPPRLPHPEIDWGRCCRLLIKEYGPNGDNVAFEMVQTGVDGGFYAVLKAIARQIADEYAGNQIRSRISDFWESLTANEKVAVSEEYLTKYDHLLPSILLEEGAVRVRAFFGKALEEHPRIAKRMKNSVRNLG